MAKRLRIPAWAGLTVAVCAALLLTSSNLWAQGMVDPKQKQPKKMTPQRQAPKQMTPTRPQAQRVSPQRQAVPRVTQPQRPQRQVVRPTMPAAVPPPPARRPRPPYWAAAAPLLVLPPLMHAASPPPPPPVPPYGAQLVVMYANHLKVRNCPDTQCEVIGMLQRGTPVQLLEYRSRFALVRVAGTNYEGWVLYKYLAPAP